VPGDRIDVDDADRADHPVVAVGVPAVFCPLFKGPAEIPGYAELGQGEGPSGGSEGTVSRLKFRSHVLSAVSVSKELHDRTVPSRVSVASNKVNLPMIYPREHPGESYYPACHCEESRWIRDDEAIFFLYLYVFAMQ